MSNSYNGIFKFKIGEKARVPKQGNVKIIGKQGLTRTGGSYTVKALSGDIKREWGNKKLTFYDFELRKIRKN